MRCWQPLPVENHLLHNEVAQIGIEGEINVESIWTLRCRLWRHVCQSHDRWVFNLHDNPVNAGRANIHLWPLSFQEIKGKATAFSGRSDVSWYATQIFRTQVQSKTDTSDGTKSVGQVMEPSQPFSRDARSIMVLVANFLPWNFVKFADYTYGHQ